MTLSFYCVHRFIGETFLSLLQLSRKVQVNACRIPAAEMKWLKGETSSTSDSDWIALYLYVEHRTTKAREKHTHECLNSERPLSSSERRQRDLRSATARLSFSPRHQFELCPIEYRRLLSHRCLSMPVESIILDEEKCARGRQTFACQITGASIFTPELENKIRRKKKVERN